MGVHISAELKSGNSYRTIPVTDSVIAELLEHKKRQNSHINTFGLMYKSQYDLVFPHENGNPKDPGDISHYFKDLVRRLKLPEQLHFHDIRHTYASTLAELDIHPKKMQLFLGHADAAFTMNVYTHKTEEMFKGIKEKLEKKRRGSQKVVTTQRT